MTIYKQYKQPHFYKKENRKQCLLDFICLAALKAADAGAATVLFH